MALSLLVDVNASSPTGSALGWVELIDRGNSTKQLENSGDCAGDCVSKTDEALLTVEQNKTPCREIRITLKSPDEIIYRQLWQASQKHPVLNVVELKVLPNEIASKTGRAWVRRGGKLSYDCKWSQEKGVGKCEPKTPLNFPQQSINKRRIFHGYHEYDIHVAIEKMEMRSDLMTEIEREFRILRELDIHENFIRYFSFETDEKNDFVYIATELCLCSVADLFQHNSKDDKIRAAEILSSLSTKGILFQATRGLDYLHQNHFVHRNVKPSSFLIKEIQSGNSSNRFAIKITDFRLSRQLDSGKDLSGTVASEGWEAPESRREKQPLHQSLDVFILGCFYHYVLTGTDDDVNPSPIHPFGAGEFMRHLNIPNSKYDVYKKEWIPKGINNNPKAIALVKRMVQFNEQDRPTLTQILEDPYFQPPTREYYPIYTYDIPGLCVIFNQEIFTKLTQRTGTTHDWRRLKFTFENLGFQVVIHHNLMSFDIRGEIKKIAARNFSKYGCLVVCLLSHGIENAIAGADSIYVNVNKLKYKFSYNNCPSLYGKPKIFLVQACQGDLEQNQKNIVPLTLLSADKSVGENKESTVQLSTSSAAVKYVTNCFNSLNKDSTPNRNPPIMDFITIKSTIPGFVSMRNALTGTYFIQALCQRLEAEYLTHGEASLEVNKDQKRDLEGILRGEDGVQSIMNSNIQNREYRQTVSWETYLSKYVVFRSINQNNTLKYEEALDIADEGSDNNFLNEKYPFFVTNGQQQQ